MLCKLVYNNLTEIIKTLVYALDIYRTCSLACLCENGLYRGERDYICSGFL